MGKFDYLEPDLRNCKLCEWRCGIDRLGDENSILNNTGLEETKINSVCGITLPIVASSQLHPAPPSSFDAFLAGCNFRCLFCQNWTISMFDLNVHSHYRDFEGYYDPSHWSELALAALSSQEAQYIKADRLFFTGGEPTCSLPWIEAVVEAARQIMPEVKVNYDTNGFMTLESLKRVLKFTTSITFDLKAFNSKLFNALTGANVKPVLRNLKYILKHAPDKIWEVRVMVIPGVHDYDVEDMCKYLADLDPELKLNFLAFRPNFTMEGYDGAPEELLNEMVRIAHSFGLENTTWSGRAGVRGKSNGKSKGKDEDTTKQKFKRSTNASSQPEYIANLLTLAWLGGCDQEVRNCGACEQKIKCNIKKYKARSLM